MSATPNLQPLFAQMLRNARSVREHLGDDSWRVVHQLRQRVDTFNPSLGASAARRACEGLSAQIAAFLACATKPCPTITAGVSWTLAASWIAC
ncbi:hypothetical protein DK37_14965 [Halomonas sp. SUBG004]|nr:hypothetical protein DK37_14965 [Halomonas sp. SUBG004]